MRQTRCYRILESRLGTLCYVSEYFKYILPGGIYPWPVECGAPIEQKRFRRAKRAAWSMNE